MARKDIADDLLDLDLEDIPEVLTDILTPETDAEASDESASAGGSATEEPSTSTSASSFSSTADDTSAPDGGDAGTGKTTPSTTREEADADEDDAMDGFMDGLAGSSMEGETVDDASSSVAAATSATKPFASETVKVRGTREDDVFTATAASETIRTHKGDDTLEAGAGDDLVVSGHGDDVLDGGAGDDVVNGGKGDDTLVYTLAENAGGSDHYDGGKGYDTLELRLTVDEYNELHEELVDLKDWMADHSNVKASSGVKFKDGSSNGAEKHAVYETSFGLEVRYTEDLKVVVEGHGEVSLDVEFLEDVTPSPIPEPTPEPDVSPELVTIDVSEAVAGDVPVSVTLKAGSTTTVSINVDVTERPAIYDVFMVQDLSGSFWDDLPNVKSLLPELIDSLNATSDVAFGIGSFVDKPYETFGWTNDYVYKTDQAISKDFEAVQATMDGLTTYSGYDYPESQLEALVQTALRGAEIGFRDGAQKYVVLSTDAAFHKAGDFTSTTDADGNVVDVMANDYDTDFELEDYPELMKVGELLQASGITPVFAVTTWVMPTYQALVDSWGFGSVVELASDSANITDAINTGLDTATVDLTLDVTGDDYGYVTGMTPEVYPDAGPGSYTFDITLEVPEDTSAIGSDGLSVSIPGYGTIALDIEIASMDLTGDDEANVLVGDDDDNVIDGMGGDDTLTGGVGNDTFVFASGFGNDTVTDFTTGDVLDLRRVASVTTAADVMAAASQVGSDTVIDFGEDGSLVLEGVDMTSLSNDDFVL